jgi:hypothetical protein
MDIGKLDGELNLKMKEAYKAILKKNGTRLTFDYSKTKFEELVKVENEIHYFTLEKTKKVNELMETNHKYDFILNRLLKRKNPERRTIIMKRLNILLFFLKPFMGSVYKTTPYDTFSYIMVYNGIVIELSKIEFERCVFYAKYIYKVQQLSKLNSELGIAQDFTVIFDDDVEIKKIYVEMYNDLKGILEPFSNEVKILLKKNNDDKNSAN